MIAPELSLFVVPKVVWKLVVVWGWRCLGGDYCSCAKLRTRFPNRIAAAEPKRVPERCSFAVEPHGSANIQTAWNYYETFEEVEEDRAFRCCAAAAPHKQQGALGNPTKLAVVVGTDVVGTATEDIRVEHTIPVVSREDTSFAKALPNYKEGLLESVTIVAMTWRTRSTPRATERGDFACSG